MIDILLAAYNGEAYIKEQLLSILHQSRRDFRILIRDDVSSDRTVSIVKKVLEEEGETERAVIISDGKASGSAKNNFIRLIKLQDAEYVMFSDQDDIWERDKILDSMQLMERAEKKYGKETPILVHTDLYVMDQEGKIVSDSLIEYMKLPRKDSLKNLLLQNSVTGCTVLLNHAAAELLKQAEETDAFVIHDHFAAVLIALFGRVICLKKPEVRYRQHAGNVIGASNAGSFQYMFRRFLRGPEKFRRDMEDCYRQAEAILVRYSDRLGQVTEEKRKLIQGFAALADQKSGVKRRFFRDNNMYKRGRIKKIMQILWC